MRPLFVGLDVSRHPFVPRTPLARRQHIGQVNPLRTKEGARRRLLTRPFQTSPNPSLVRRGTFASQFIEYPLHLGRYIEGHDHTAHVWYPATNGH